MTSSGATTTPPTAQPFKFIINANTPEGWDKCAEKYAAAAINVTEPFAALLVNEAKLSTNDSVLDLACGSGVIAKYAVPLVKSVHSTDFSPNFVQIVKRNIQEWGEPWCSRVTAYVQDAQTLKDVPDSSMDHVFCCFGIFMVPDLEAGLQQIYRVLKPGGQAHIAVWSTVVDSEFHRVLAMLHDVLNNLGKDDWTPAPISSLNSPPLATPEQLTIPLKKVGFINVDTKKHSRVSKTYESPEEFVNMLDGIAPTMDAMFDKIKANKEKAIPRLGEAIDIIRSERKAKGENFEGDQFRVDITALFHAATKP